MLNISNGMLLILVQKETNRLRYIMQLIFTNLLGIEIRFTQDVSFFDQYDGPKFSYGVAVDEDILFFVSSGLLFESKISAKDLKHSLYKGQITLFSIKHMAAALPYDPFAASFYLVSRYEEYLPHLRDKHNRFLAEGSDAFQHGYLEKPMVNIWSLQIKEILITRYPDLQFSVQDYKFIPTIDVDAAYAYKNKGLTRAFGGIIKAIRKKDFDEVRQRIRVLMGIEKDPFDTFELQLSLQKQFGYQPIYFILLADYGPNDKNIPHNNRHFRSLIRYLSDYAEIGIHPSYASSQQPSLIEMETARLSKILKMEVSLSRQHFLKLTLPDTYRDLLNNDISHDFTMGYAEAVGFRASICTPFSFFDLDQDTATNLYIHPFAVMDGTLKDYLKLSPEQSIKTISKLLSEVKQVSGTFISLWHNQTLNDTGEWHGWLSVFINMVEDGMNQ